MFEKTMVHCPGCEAIVREEIRDGTEFTCPSCSRRYSVMIDEQSGKAGFVELAKKEAPEPLFLPRGSIRALVTLAMSFSCWLMILTGKDAPGYLLSLLLAIIGYYFGFRKKIKTAESRIFDASAVAEEPLFLPPGVIRFFLVVGFVISGIVLCARGRFDELPYLEFFIILFGLILGYIVAKAFSSYEGGPLHSLVNHLKGAVVLAAAFYLMYLFLSGAHGDANYLPLVLAAIISFYFGSRA